MLFEQHTVNVLLGQEANASNNRYIEGSIGSLINTDVDSRYIQDALGDGNPATSDAICPIMRCPRWVCWPR